MLLVYPVRLEALRYLLPIFPFLILYILKSFEILTRNFLSPMPRRGLALLFFSGLYIPFYVAHDPLARPAFYTADTASLEMFGFIKRQLNADDVLLARKPRLMALMSDRRSTIWPEHPTLQSFWVYSDKVNATYLLELTKCVPSDLDELSGIIDESEQRLRLIFENNEFRIYKIRHL